MQPADPANKGHGARPKERTSQRTDPLRRLDVRQSSYAYDERETGRLPLTSSHVSGQSIPHPQGGTVLPEADRGLRVQPGCSSPLPPSGNPTGIKHEQRY